MKIMQHSNDAEQDGRDGSTTLGFLVSNRIMDQMK